MAKFAKGQSGNPGGRPKDSELRESARAHTEEAIKTLAEIMRNKKSPAQARIAAACALLDRGHGKPIQMTELTGPEGGPIEISSEEATRRIAYLLNKAGKAR